MWTKAVILCKPAYVKNATTTKNDKQQQQQLKSIVRWRTNIIIKMFRLVK